MFYSKSTSFFGTCFNTQKSQSSSFELNFKNNETKGLIKKQKISLKKSKFNKNLSTITLKAQHQSKYQNNPNLSFNPAKYCKKKSTLNDKNEQVYKINRLPPNIAKNYTNQLKNCIKNDFSTKLSVKKQSNNLQINYNSNKLQKEHLVEKQRKPTHLKFSQKCIKNQPFLPFQKPLDFLQQPQNSLHIMNSLPNLYQTQQIKNKNCEKVKWSQINLKKDGQKQIIFNSMMNVMQQCAESQKHCKLSSMKTKQSLQECKTTNPSQSMLLDKSIKSNESERGFSIILSQIIETKNETESVLNSFKDQTVEEAQNIEELLPKIQIKKSPFSKTSAFHQIHLNNPQINDIRETLSVRSDVTETEYSFVIE